MEVINRNAHTDIWDSVQQNRACEVIILIILSLSPCYTKQHIFATVQPFPLKVRTLVLTSSLYVEIDFSALIIFHAASTKIANPAG